MDFSEQRLELGLAFGSSAGVERRTEILSLASGFEQRATPWSHGRRRFLVSGGVRSLDEAAELTRFFESVRGRLIGFRFRDFADWKSCDPSRATSPLDQPLGNGDGARRQFQLTKRYGSGDVAYDRPIRKPVAGSVRVAVNGIAATSGFDVDTATGLVTFAAAPASGAVLTAGYEFDVPVRFDVDRLDITLESFEAARVAAFTLIEVRV